MMENVWNSKVVKHHGWRAEVPRGSKPFMHHI